jgi:solute carrier family 25 (adenine nucleotide translocator) protein 4/5/6/31
LFLLKKPVLEITNIHQPSFLTNFDNNNNVSLLTKLSVKMTDFMSSFLAGGVSAAVANTFAAPLTTVKVRMHANPKIDISAGGQSLARRSTQIIYCVTYIAREQGIKAFWRGNLTNIIRYSPSYGFSFAFKDGIKSRLFPDANKYTDDFGKVFIINIGSAGLAGATSPLIIYPLDYARTRLASDAVVRKKAQFNGLVDCMKQTVISGGIRSLYTGYGISVLGNIPYRGVYFGLFDTLSEYNPFQKDDESNPKRVLSKFVCAQISAIAAGYTSYPFDTIRRRLQMQSGEKKRWQRAIEQQRLVHYYYSGIYDCFTKIIKNEGTSALFKGSGVNVSYSFGAALTLVVYSEITSAAACSSSFY